MNGRTNMVIALNVSRIVSPMAGIGQIVRKIRRKRRRSRLAVSFIE
ncbi:hypothetical protein ACFO9Q_18895 [Paenibacillus sp. GCM10023252]